MSNESIKRFLGSIGITKGSILYKKLKTVYHLFTLAFVPISRVEELFHIRLYGWHKRRHRNKFYGEGRTAYDSLYRRNAQWWKSDDSDMRRIIVSVNAEQLNSPVDKILDLGCGHGRTLARLSYDLMKLSGVRLIGLDFSIEGLSHAKYHKIRRGFSLDLICGDMTSAPFRDQSFGLIISNGSHEHIENPSFEECRRMLKKGGLFLCLVPIVGESEAEINWEIINVQRENKLKKKTWVEMLERDGFNVAYDKGVFICRPL